ncbi:MAG: hypothetical protein EYC62_02105 [Alphaproteobacteria bacterium]|nr:MAG: hypothetical protein EYC62_02105 [Alphaproteobacteria bacterium]
MMLSLDPDVRPEELDTDLIRRKVIQYSVLPSKSLAWIAVTSNRVELCDAATTVLDSRKLPRNFVLDYARTVATKTRN